MKNLTWIGTGVMGSPMVGHLIDNGYSVRVFNNTFSKAKRLEDEKGAIACKSIAEAVNDSDYIFTMVGYPRDVEKIYLGDGGIFESAKKGAVVIDMTTSSPELANRLYKTGKEIGIRVLDAPVSGGDLGAKNASLSIMVGGDFEDYIEIRSLFEHLGKNINYLGSAGNGQHAKAANQIAVAGATASMIEAIFYAESVGLDPEKMFTAIGSGAAGSWQISNMAPRVLKGDLAPGFFIKHFLKDMSIVKKEIESRGYSLEMLNAVYNLYKEMVNMGLENDGTQALIKYYRG
ncbi:NAD(P)-dependent oxidoreductase [Sporosarcina sp. SAFN-015]|uniref:NAD(P)-dependent oxidoreductase n=1 Tax=Sporosarcina sp. SAFN-015 TaxID=3387274 RepID=UPI003F7DD09B